MYYTFAHPKEIDFFRQEDYNLLYAKVLDGLGISELTVPDFNQMDIFVKKEKILQLVNSLSWELTDIVKNELVDFLYDDIFASLEGANYADNQADYTQLRSCSGQLQAVVEDYIARNQKSLTALSVVGTMDARDFEYIRTSLDSLVILDLSDAIPVGPALEDLYVIPDQALYREDGLMQMDEVCLHDLVRRIGSEAFRNCQNLVYVFLSKSLTEIGPSAFKGCKNISKIVFPQKVKTIGDGAFADCPILRTVLSLNSEPPTLGNDSFIHRADSRLIVPVETTDKYASSSWSLYFNTPFEHDTGDFDNYHRIREARKNYIGYTLDEKRAVIRMMTAMSYSDNSPHMSEEILIFNTGKKTFDLSENEVMEAKKMDILDAVRILVRMSQDKKEDLFKKVQLVAEADGGYTAGEKKLYQLLKEKL